MKRRSYTFFILLCFLTLYTTHLVLDLLAVSKVIALLIALATMFFVVAWQFIARLKPKKTEFWWARSLAWIGAISMGFWSMLVGMNIFYDLVLQLPFHFFLPAETYLWIHKVLFFVAAIFSICGWLIVNSGPKIKRVKIPLEGDAQSATAALKNFKLVQISDLHVGPTIRKKYVQKVVELTNSLNPSVVVFTGDMVDGEPDLLREYLLPLKDIQATHGVFYITGNHEFYWGAERWIEEFRALSCTTLVNENKVIDFHGAKILIAGITDDHAEHFVPSLKTDILAAAKSTVPSEYKILLAHRADTFAAAEQLGFHLLLSGHTHAGQYFPWNLIISFFHKYYRGLEKYRRLWIYVNVGTGYWGPANRFGVPAEITEIRFS